MTFWTCCCWHLGKDIALLTDHCQLDIMSPLGRRCKIVFWSCYLYVYNTISMGTTRSLWVQHDLYGYNTISMGTTRSPWVQHDLYGLACCIYFSNNKCDFFTIHLPTNQIVFIFLQHCIFLIIGKRTYQSRVLGIRTQGIRLEDVNGSTVLPT